MKINFFLVVIFTVLLYGNNINCNYIDKNFKKELKEYKFRIDETIEEHNLNNCYILYAYNHFLSNSFELDAMENDISYMTQLGEFIKNYPETGKLITTRIDFEFLNSHDLKSKNSIEYAVKETKLSINNKKENIQYLLMALNAQYNSKNSLDENLLKQDLNYLKNNYKLKDLKYLMPFWSIYYNIHKKDKTASQTRELFKFFNNTVKNIGLNTLKNYYNWRHEIYSIFIPENFKNIEYINCIVTLLNNSDMKDRYKINFLKEIASIVEEMTDNKYSTIEIRKYLQPFMQNKQLMAAIFNEVCSKNEDKLDVEIISSFMETKIKFVNEQPMIFNEIIKSLENKKLEDQIVIISYFNYMTSIYTRLAAVNKQDILTKLYKELSNDKTYNMRDIMVLGEYSSYFDDLVNNNWQNKDYIYILKGVVRDGYRVSDSFKNKSWTEDDAKQFKSSVYFLIRTPHNELDDMTIKEIGNVALDVVDTASYATILIPGVGVGIAAARALAKQSVKAAIKQIAKKGIVNSLKKQSSKAYKSVKKIAKKFSDNRIRYGDRRTKAVSNLNSIIKKIDRWDFKYDIASTSVTVGIFVYDYFYSNNDQKNLCEEN